MRYRVHNGWNSFAVRTPEDPENWKLKVVERDGRWFYEDLPPGLMPGGEIIKLRAPRDDEDFEMYFVPKEDN